MSHPQHGQEAPDTTRTPYALLQASQTHRVFFFEEDAKYHRLGERQPIESLVHGTAFLLEFSLQDVL
jgi:hypothetical protein